jgi:hypothetical protein
VLSDLRTTSPVALHVNLSRYSDLIRVGRPGFDFRQRSNFSLPSQPPDRLWAHPASYTMGTGCSFPVVKWLGREPDHSPPTSDEVKKIWIYTSTLPYAFMAQCLSSYTQGQLYLTNAAVEVPRA